LYLSRTQQHSKQNKTIYLIPVLITGDVKAERLPLHMYQAVGDHRLQQHDRQAVDPDPKMLQHSTDWCGIG